MECTVLTKCLSKLLLLFTYLLIFVDVCGSYKMRMVSSRIAAMFIIFYLLIEHNYRLEEEEQCRQKLQLEKMAAESKMKSFGEDIALKDDTNEKLFKEKKNLEERFSELSMQCVEEEEKAKQLGKLKTKYEAIISDLEERLRKEQQVRHQLDRIIYIFQL